MRRGRFPWLISPSEKRLSDIQDRLAALERREVALMEVVDKLLERKIEALEALMQDHELQNESLCIIGETMRYFCQKCGREFEADAPEILPGYRHGATRPARCPHEDCMNYKIVVIKR